MMPQTTNIRRLVSQKTDKVVWTFHTPASVYNRETCYEYLVNNVPNWVPAGKYYVLVGVSTQNGLVFRRRWTGIELLPPDDDDGDESNEPEPQPALSI